MFLSVNGLSTCLPAAQGQWCHQGDPSEEYREEYAHADQCQSHNGVQKMLNEFSCEIEIINFRSVAVEAVI